MNASKKTQFDRALEHSTVDFLTNASDNEVTAFFQEEGFDVHTLAQQGRDALARAQVAAAGSEAKEASTGSVNPFSDIERPEYRNLAHELGINTMFLNRIRDREVLLSDFPAIFLERLAAGLRVTIETLRQYLSLPPAPTVGGMFQSDAKPVIADEASPFTTVARESGLSEDEIKRLFE
ncbi:hypothetical protein [Trinickia mobilis]|uniref:hypothetical protein n=1 Tax=Trinickia mobilis TaxID=2816356 RepID=UPI001A8C1E45|nr:hypothetical protein [Trinickia mobilis]